MPLVYVGHPDRRWGASMVDGMSPVTVQTAPATREAPWPVAAMSQKIREWIDRLGTVWVEGEITQWQERGGHVYGKLKDLSGLIFGHFSDIKDNAIPFGKDAYEIIAEHSGKYNYPVCYGFPTGHEPDNLALVCGRRARLEVTDQGTSLTYDYIT